MTRFDVGFDWVLLQCGKQATGERAMVCLRDEALAAALAYWHQGKRE